MAKEAGLDEAAAAKSIALMVFPSVNEQLSKQWLGGNVQEFMKGVADVFVAAGSLKKALPSYDGVVNTAPLKQIAK